MSPASGKELAKTYEAALHEPGIYERWERSGFFSPEKLPGERATHFTVMMPPPNRTGTLHIGHATGLAIQDLMVRFERMRGKRALWVPGTDHAAIATQVKVEQLLIEQGMKHPRAELGRDKFLERVVAFAEESKETINRQIRRMGASCDWSRERYTLDEPRSRAVVEMFRLMHEDGIIERGFRVVNWDPQFQTTLSDDEVETKQVNARLLTFRYDADFPIAISTTRPETKFGDTAVAVHPEDDRYRNFVGKTFTPTFCGKRLTIRVIADAAVDPQFGTGALGVTPAHSMIDAELAERHGLPMEPVIGKDGRMSEAAGPAFAGLAIAEARKKIEAALNESGLLESVVDTAQNLPVAERGGAPVEQLPLEQWFVRVNKPFTLRNTTLGKWKKGAKATLKDLMRAAVESGAVRILPEQFAKVYFHWIQNLRDWCISRQIWFGHRVPVWYRGGEARVGAVSPGTGWEQDSDTLDTWFSSGMWTFSTLGWPEETDDLSRHHPTDVLETGRDIIFFWVARMILMSAYALGEVPFRTVYLHGLVRDEKGRKMSKSLGNIIDPLDVAAEYGTDAVRLSLVVGSAPGMDTRISVPKIAGFRNFTNKLWNIGRYVSGTKDEKARVHDSTADRWIRSRLSAVTAEVTAHLEAFRFSAAGETLRAFTWNEFADWYVEIHKREGNDAVLREVFGALLRLWHPFMPFVTEALHESLGGEGLLMVATWPAAEGKRDEAAEKTMAELQEVVGAIRSIRGDYGIAPETAVDAVVEAPFSSEALTPFAPAVSALAKVGTLTIAREILRPPQSATITVGTNTVSVPLAGIVDFAKEQKRIGAAIAEAEGAIRSIESRIGNPDFSEKAPEAVVASERERLEAARARLERLRAALAALG